MILEHRFGVSYPIRTSSYVTLCIPPSSRAVEKYPPIWRRGLMRLVRYGPVPNWMIGARRPHRPGLASDVTILPWGTVSGCPV